MGSPVTEIEATPHRVRRLAHLDRPRTAVEAKLLQAAGIRYGYRTQREQAKHRERRLGR